MRLLVISHTPHYVDDDGRLLGFGPTVRELDQLATLFDEVVHVAPRLADIAPTHARPYASDRIRVRAIAPAGGDGLVAKLGIVRRIPGWVRVIRAELDDVDVVHVRCPANVSLIAVVMLALRRRPTARWVKYAGNWSPTGGEALSYRLQRWLLRRNACRAAVTVNGSWPKQPRHVHTFVNPAFTDEELSRATRAASRKSMSDPVRILFAGRLDWSKGPQRTLALADRLRARGVRFHLDLAGDGPERRRCEAFAAEHDLSDDVTFHGWLDRATLDRLYAEAHVLLLPSVAAEGFPKVLSEAMAYGAVPVASDISCIRQVLTESRAGVTVPPCHVAAVADAIVTLTDTELWQEHSTAAVAAAPQFTYTRYLDAVRALLFAPAARLRIGVFGPHLGSNPGWVTSQGEVLVRLLSDAGHDVHEASTRPSWLPRVLDTAAVMLHRAGSLDVAVVSVYSGRSFAIAEMTVALASACRVPVILVLHGGNLPSFASPHWRRVGRLLARADAVVAPSPFLVRELAHFRGDIIVVSNALPDRFYPTRTRGPLRPRLLWMRTFEATYRPHLALETLVALRTTHPTATLTLAGQDAGLLEETKTRAADLGIADAVDFPGFLDPEDKRRALDEHDVFLSTSAVDNTPVSVLEAATSGLVVVAMRAGGLADLVVDGEHALLVPDGDAVAMAQAVRSILDDAALARRLSHRAQELGAPSSQPRVLSKWEVVLGRVTDASRSRR